MSAVMMFLLHSLLGDEVVSNFFKISWVSGLSRLVLCLCKISLGMESVGLLV